MITKHPAQVALERIVALCDAPYFIQNAGGTGGRREKIRELAVTALKSTKTAHFGLDGARNEYRWWESNWFQDQFDFVAKDCLNARIIKFVRDNNLVQDGLLED